MSKAVRSESRMFEVTDCDFARIPICMQSILCVELSNINQTNQFLLAFVCLVGPLSLAIGQV